MKNSVLVKLNIPLWATMTDGQRKQVIISAFETLKSRLGLDYYLTFDAPTGFETAFANCDNYKKAVFINPKFITPDSLFCLYNLFHEMRHAYQFEQVSGGQGFKNLAKNFTYYFQ